MDGWVGKVDRVEASTENNKGGSFDGEIKRKCKQNKRS